MSYDLSTVPSPLYHYTGQTGLSGIIGNQTVWASQVQYLNDGSELELCLDLTRRYLRKHSEYGGDSLRGKALRVYEDFVSRIGGPNVFVASFSEVGDLLSQWRGYTRPGDAYALGFEPQMILPPDSPPFWKLVRCQYTAAEHTETIAKHVAHHLQRLENDRSYFPDEDADKRIDSSGFVFARELMTVAPVIKHDKFSEEREWRLISNVLRLPNEKVSFRQGKHTLIPYYRWSLTNMDSVSTRIIVGPGQHASLARDAVGSLLRNTGVAGEVTTSTIPFRDW